MNTKELHEGIGGNGSKVFLVVTVSPEGRWLWIETFKSEAQALNWIEWA